MLLLAGCHAQSSTMLRSIHWRTWLLSRHSCTLRHCTRTTPCRLWMLWRLACHRRRRIRDDMWHTRGTLYTRNYSCLLSSPRALEFLDRWLLVLALPNMAVSLLPVGLWLPDCV